MVWKTAVDWEHGMFLKPQHFQCAELHQQFLLSRIMSSITPYFWGFSQLQLDHQAIKNGRFEVEKMALFLPTGEYIEMNTNAIFLPRSFVQVWTKQTNNLKVFIGVKKLSATKKNVTTINNKEDLSGITTRYISQLSEAEVPDWYHQGEQTQIKSLQYVVKIFWEFELENTSNYILMQIAELRKIDNDIKNNPAFMPTCVSISATENLYFNLRNHLENLITICGELEKFKIPIDWYSVQIDKVNFARLLSLRTLLRYIPVLKHYVNAEHVHPWHVFILLHEIICELSYFTTELNLFSSSQGRATSLPDYNHDDLTSCFGSTRTLIQKLIITIVADPGRIHRMIKEKNYYYADLGNYFIGPERKYYLVIYAENNQDEIAEIVQDSGKLCVYSDIDTYVEYALPGVPITKLQAVPDGVPRGGSCLYYLIDHKSELWLKVERQLKVAFYMEKAPIDVVIDIVAVGG
ncbi:TPA: type VI secretion system baseplate subunit TssK [Legionella pneumophila]|nr:type VI secretion system baseplate subunit TssK [Legionella pneumophila]HAT2137530.1 type VI secretion system baseplate subunit TssK [Legionella pneumophila]HAT2143642.1 type VI secretion system baseplate subunit TssK [Legionella pneumophila]HAT2146789.1 type VI secretion system baseplate subunit TssK [Legionella pneumophila]HAT2161910.1 type VI secretion system baseplate subunit TssK [Legionella pneumophila]